MPHVYLKLDQVFGEFRNRALKGMFDKVYFEKR